MQAPSDRTPSYAPPEGAVRRRSGNAEPATPGGAQSLTSANEVTDGAEGGRATTVLDLAMISSMLDQARLPLLVLDESLRARESNHALLQGFGVRSASSVLGSALGDLFRPPTVREMQRLALEVLTTHAPVLDRRMLWAPLGAPPALARTSMWPLISDGRTEGVAVTARMPELPEPAMQRIAEAAAYIHENIGGRLETTFLADRSGVSLSQFQRDFLTMLGSTPKRYIVSVRFEQALEMLARGEAIASVAHACGYSDQSAFTRQFRTTMGMAPTAYIRRMATPKLNEAARLERAGRQQRTAHRSMHD